jgi:hypothetical protein
MPQSYSTAPIVLFAYNRVDHVRKTIEALEKNPPAKLSDIFIYSDAARNHQDERAVSQVRDYLGRVSGFKSIDITHQKENQGLAKSIIHGVTDIVNRYGKVIVIEDDIVTSRYFLDYMNKALNHYEKQQSVWHIGGWTPPISTDGLDEAFFWRGMNCWGWATWSDRWEHFEKDPVALINGWDEAKIHQFNLDGTCDFWRQITLNQSQVINTWAIFWYATIFQHQGICLQPTLTLVENIGHDGTGENSIKSRIYSTVINGSPITKFPRNTQITTLAETRIKNFYQRLRPVLPLRVASKIKRLIVKLIRRRHVYN